MADALRDKTPGNGLISRFFDIEFSVYKVQSKYIKNINFSIEKKETPAGYRIFYIVANNGHAGRAAPAEGFPCCTCGRARTRTQRPHRKTGPAEGGPAAGRREKRGVLYGAGHAGRQAADNAHYRKPFHNSTRGDTARPLPGKPDAGRAAWRRHYETEDMKK